MRAGVNPIRLASTRQTISRVLAPLAIAALPLVLLYSSVRTFWELDEQKAVYLRNRVATVAGRLENLPVSKGGEDVFELLSEEEPYLLDVELIERRNAPSDLAPIWNGQELFRMGFHDKGHVFRAYVPFHSSVGLRIARIDLDASAASFLVDHARHNVIIASLAGLVLILLAWYALWATRRAARLEVRQLEMEHLVHMGKMAAVLAHEIRNPLGTIKGFAQLIGERAGPSMDGFLEPILSETTRLERLVNDLLLYGRPPRPALRPAKWEEIVLPLQADARLLIGSRPIRFLADCTQLEWETDPHLLHQALLNLVRNAVESIGDGDGEVRLELRGSEANGVTLSVTDNGAGIPDDVRSRLFEPFFTTKASGTGLGLSITRRLVASMGGELTLKPAAGRGIEAVLQFSRVSFRKAGD